MTQNLGLRDYLSQKHCLSALGGRGTINDLLKAPSLVQGCFSLSSCMANFSLIPAVWSAAGAVHPPTLTGALLRPAYSSSPGPDFFSLLLIETPERKVSLGNKQTRK